MSIEHVVHKYELKRAMGQLYVADIPYRARCLDFEMQGSALQGWFLTDLAQKRLDRHRFRVLMTGQVADLSPGIGSWVGEHVKTIHPRGSVYVIHLFRLNIEENTLLHEPKKEAGSVSVTVNGEAPVHRPNCECDHGHNMDPECVRLQYIQTFLVHGSAG